MQDYETRKETNILEYYVDTKLGLIAQIDLNPNTLKTVSSFSIM